MLRKTFFYSGCLVLWELASVKFLLLSSDCSISLFILLSHCWNSLIPTLAAFADVLFPSNVGSFVNFQFGAKIFALRSDFSCNRGQCMAVHQSAHFAFDRQDCSFYFCFTVSFSFFFPFTVSFPLQLRIFLHKFLTGKNSVRQPGPGSSLIFLHRVTFSPKECRITMVKNVYSIFTHILLLSFWSYTVTGWQDVVPLVLQTGAGCLGTWGTSFNTD